MRTRVCTTYPTWWGILSGQHNGQVRMLWGQRCGLLGHHSRKVPPQGLTQALGSVMLPFALPTCTAAIGRAAVVAGAVQFGLLRRWEPCTCAERITCHVNMHG
eukprot:1157758-Pelagomonas_calceolata.AAC.2